MKLGIGRDLRSVGALILSRSARLIGIGSRNLLPGLAGTFFGKRTCLSYLIRRPVFCCWAVVGTQDHFLSPSLSGQVLAVSSMREIESKIQA